RSAIRRRATIAWRCVVISPIALRGRAVRLRSRSGAKIRRCLTVEALITIRRGPIAVEASPAALSASIRLGHTAPAAIDHAPIVLAAVGSVATIGLAEVRPATIVLAAVGSIAAIGLREVRSATVVLAAVGSIAAIGLGKARPATVVLSAISAELAPISTAG